MKRTLLLVAFLVAFFFLAVGDSKAKEGSLVTVVDRLNITYDNEVNSGHPNRVYRISGYSNVGYIGFYNSAYRYYLYIDLSSIPKNTKIKRATLYLDLVSKSWDQDGLYELYRILSPWNTYDLTWSTQPEISDQYASGIEGSHWIYSFDVTKFVRLYHKNEKQNHGFVVRKPIEAGNNKGLFATVDYSLSGRENRPYLEVEYYLHK